MVEVGVFNLALYFRFLFSTAGYVCVICVVKHLLIEAILIMLDGGFHEVTRPVEIGL